MSNVLIIGSGKEPELERLMKMFRSQGYQVYTADPAVDFSKAINGRNYGVVVHARGVDAPAVQDVHGLRIDFLKAQTEANRKSEHAWYNLGRAYSEQGNDDAALEAFMKTISLNPKHLDGICYVLEIVEKDPERIKKFDKGSAITRFLGWRSQFDEQENGISQLEKLVTDDETNPKPFAILGDLKLATGDTQGAVESYRKALSRMSDADLQEILRAAENDEDAMRRIASGLGKADRVTAIFGQTVLKVYEEHEADRAIIESAFYTAAEAKANRNLFKTPSGRQISLPKFSAPLRGLEGQGAINRMEKIPGESAYKELAALDGEERVQLLTILNEAAATLAHAYTIGIPERDPQFEKMFKDTRVTYLKDRIQRKFFQPLDNIHGVNLSTADRAHIDAALQFAGSMLTKDVPNWLLSVRMDNVPKNFILHHEGIRGTFEEYLRNVQIGNIDKENADIVHGVWDTVHLNECYGAAVSRDDAFSLMLYYMLNRLNLAKDGKKDPRQLVWPNDESRADRINEYISGLDASYGRQEQSNPESKPVAPYTKARFHHLGLSWARHIEIAGIKMTLEHAYRGVLDKILKHVPEELRGKVKETDSTDDRYIAAGRKVHQFVCNLAAERSFYVERARESLEELARDKDTLPEVRRLYVVMEHRKVYDAALLSLGS